MKLAISYFYQIRNFKRNMIPVSTAVWDPKWYHNFQDSQFTFLDKRGIVNGLRCEELHGDETCQGLCFGKENCECKDPSKCEFLKAYRQQLEKMNLNAFLERANKSAKRIQEQLKFSEEPIIVLIVYETPTNPCSERQVLIDYFNSHNIECKELEYPII